MSNAAEVFESNRTRLFRIAYRMLKSRADAEDALQEAFVRWHQSTESSIQQPTAFLITVITRLCLDHLRRLKKERDRGALHWLPEPVVGDYAPSPEAHSEIAKDVAAAFVAVLECLGTAERTAFLLHDVFDFDYPEVARIVFKSEPACRQLVRRARVRLRDAHTRFAVTPECRERLLHAFVAAVDGADRKAVLSLIAEKVDYLANGIVDGMSSSIRPPTGRRKLPAIPVQPSQSDRSCPHAHP